MLKRQIQLLKGSVVKISLFSQGEKEGAGEGRAVEEAGGAEAQPLRRGPEQQPQAPRCPKQQQQQQQ